MTDRERLLQSLPGAEIVTREGKDGRTEFRVKVGHGYFGARRYWGGWCRTEDRAWTAALASRTSHILDRMDE